MEALKAENASEHKTMFKRIEELEKELKICQGNTAEIQRELTQLKESFKSLPDLFDEKNKVQTLEIKAFIQEGNDKKNNAIIKWGIGIITTLITASLLIKFNLK